MSTITTAAELDRLPFDTIIRWQSQSGIVGIARRVDDPDTGRLVWQFEGGFVSTSAIAALIALMGPARVIYRPDQPEPVKPSREAVAAAMNAADVRFATAEHIANAGVGPDPGSWWEAMADAVLALLPAIPGQNPAELTAHDAEVAAKAMSLDINVLTEQATRAALSAHPHLPISIPEHEALTTAALAVIVPAVTAEVRALHSSTDEPISDHYHCRPSECDQAGEGSLNPVCDECDMLSPCPTVRLLDELDAAARGERS